MASKRQTGSWRWAGFAFGPMTVLAFVASFLTHRTATALGAA